MTTVELPATTEAPARPETRRRTSGMRPSDRYAVAGAGSVAAATTYLLYGVLVPGAGLLGVTLTAYALFLASYAVLVSFDENPQAVRDRVAGTVVRTLAGLLFLALVSVVSFTAYRGAHALRHLNFFTQDMRDAGPLEPLTVGGITHAAVGTFEQIAIALLVTVPLGIACAVFLSETRGRFTLVVRTLVESMTALPSIVCGLFVYAALIIGVPLGPWTLRVEKSGVAAALAISVMMLPIVIRASDVVLRLVPASLKEASYALGASQWRTVWHVVLPTARSGLTTAVILGTARGIGETSPVLLTAGFAAGMNTDPMHGPQTSLPLATFQFVRSPQPTMIARGFGSATVLLLLVLGLFATARVIGGRQK